MADIRAIGQLNARLATVKDEEVGAEVTVDGSYNTSLPLSGATPRFPLVSLSSVQITVREGFLDTVSHLKVEADTLPLLLEALRLAVEADWSSRG